MSAKNCLKFILLKESARKFSFDFTCLACNFTLNRRHSNVIILIKTIQFLHEDELLFSIFITLSLSVKRQMCLLGTHLSHKSTETATAYNSKYSMLGCNVSNFLCWDRSPTSVPRNTYCQIYHHIPANYSHLRLYTRIEYGLSTCL